MAIKQAEMVGVNGAALVLDEIEDDGIIYPSGDGEPMADNDYQFKAIADSAWTLRRRFRGAVDVYVGSDLLIYYRRGDVSARLAPDVFVAFGARGNHPRQSWRLWREGVIPQFVLEVASESTWERDAREKRDDYRKMGVVEYWRFDPESGRHFREILIGERLVNGEYVPIEVRAGEDGALRGRSEILNLDLCVLPDAQLHLYDPAAGEWLRTPDETDDALRERDAQLLGANVALRERDARLLESNAALIERDAQLFESDAALRERDAEIERLRAALRAERGEG